MRFPADKSGKNCKLYRPWHGLYRVIAIKDPDITVAKIYFPQENQIMVHQSRVKCCHTNFQQGFTGMATTRRDKGRHLDG